jgi:hypothetical protein|tara:strand:- start:1488 stop:1742 length:255 start_codon:yes stop_codon:yes gene_type:complete
MENRSIIMSDYETREHNRKITERLSASAVMRLSETLTDVCHLEIAEEAYYRPEQIAHLRQAVKDVALIHNLLRKMHEVEFNTVI